MIVQAEKEIRQGADGAGVELARFSSALSARPGQLEARAVFGFSAADGALIGGELAVRPSSRLCMGVEAQMSHLAAEAPAASFGVAANFSGPSGRHTLALGLEDYPLQGKPPGVAPFLHVSLSTTIRVR
jgi:hypothetical protein